MRQRFQHEVRVYVRADLYERLLREAASRRITLSECVRADMREFYAIKDELMAPLEVRDDNDGGRRRIIHQILAEMETRLIAGLDRLCVEFTDAVERQSILLGSMIDRSYAGVILHLDGEVPEEILDARVASAQRRLDSWQESGTKMIEDGGPDLVRSTGRVGGAPRRYGGQSKPGHEG